MFHGVTLAIGSASSSYIRDEPDAWGRQASLQPDTGGKYDGRVQFLVVLPLTSALASHASAQQTGLVNVDLRNANLVSNIANQPNVR